MAKKRNKNPEFSSLRWACRRGMLELDLVLGHFLSVAYPSLLPAEQALFKDLLNCSDPELFAWLWGNQEPLDPRFLPLLKKIKEHGYTANLFKTI